MQHRSFHCFLQSVVPFRNINLSFKWEVLFSPFAGFIKQSCKMLAWSVTSESRSPCSAEAPAPPHGSPCRLLWCTCPRHTHTTFSFSFFHLRVTLASPLFTTTPEVREQRWKDLWLPSGPRGWRTGWQSDGTHFQGWWQPQIRQESSTNSPVVTYAL